MGNEFKIVEQKCKICMSPHRDHIDAMLARERTKEDGEPYRYVDIVDWANDQGFYISEAGLSRHRTNHQQPSLMQALETQKYMDAISQATGKKLSLHSAVANIIASKTLRLLEDLDFSQIDADRVLRVAMRAAEVSLRLERTEAMLTQETVKKVDEKLTKAGLEPETLKQIRQELYGLSS